MLGSTVRHPIDHVEVFPAPANVTCVRFTNDEVTSMCPVTQQPDLSTVVIEYVPAEWCVESKSLKLYLWGFRDRAVFAEALAAEIAGEIMATAQPERVTVTLTQRPRGGIEAASGRRTDPLRYSHGSRCSSLSSSVRPHATSSKDALVSDDDAATQGPTTTVRSPYRH